MRWRRRMMCWEDVLRCLRFGHWDHRSNQVEMHAAQRRLLRIWLIWFYCVFFLVYDSLRLEVSPLVFLSYCWTNIQYTFVTFVATNFQIQNACWENHVGFSCWKHNTKLCFYSARGSWVSLDANLLMFKNIILDLTVIPAINSWTVAMLNSHCFWPNHRADSATECSKHATQHQMWVLPSSPVRTVADSCRRFGNVERTHPQPSDPQSETGTLATHSGKTSN